MNGQRAERIVRTKNILMSVSSKNFITLSGQKVSQCQLSIVQPDWPWWLWIWTLQLLKLYCGCGKICPRWTLRLILRIFFLQDCPATLKNGKYYVSYALFTLTITKVTKVAKVVYKYFIAFNTHLPIKIFSPYFVDLLVLMGSHCLQFSWFLRVKPPQIVAFSLPTTPRNFFFRPPKFQHKKFAMSFSLFGQTQR